MLDANATRKTIEKMRNACETSGRKFAVAHVDGNGEGHALTFDRLKDCTEHARFYCTIHDTYAKNVYGYSYKTGACYIFGYDQLPFRFRAFKTN